MAKRNINYVLDHETAPKIIPVNNIYKTMTGLKMTWSPLAFFCLNCGHYTYIRQKDYSMSFDGYVCPDCGVVHTKDTILEKNYGDEMEFRKWEFINSGEVGIRIIKYKLERPGENLLRFRKMPDEVRRMTMAQALNDRSCPEVFVDELREEHGEQLDPMLVKLLDMRKNNKCWSIGQYYDKLHLVKNLNDNNPALLIPLMEALRGASVSYQAFEDMYPSYLLPLTARLIKDYNPWEDRNRTYSKPYAWNPVSVYKNYEALTCVVNYYHSGLISFKQMQKLLEYPKAINNPSFIPAFKANFMQMEAFLADMQNDGYDIGTMPLNVRQYYSDKTFAFFEEQGYTTEQVIEAFDSTKGDYLDILIRMGSTRRKRS